MSFFVESTGNKEFKMVPAGSHLARCYRIVDVGTQATEWQGQQKFLRKVMLGWEIHGEEDDGTPLLTEEGEPLAMFKNYTLSWSRRRRPSHTSSVHYPSILLSLSSSSSPA